MAEGREISKALEAFYVILLKIIGRRELVDGAVSFQRFGKLTINHGFNSERHGCEDAP